MNQSYRTRIYNNYVKGRLTRIAPDTLSGLNSRAPYLKQIIARHFPKNKNAEILDLACGHGAFICFIRAAGYGNVIGVDCSIQQVEQAKKIGIEGVVLGDSIEYAKSLTENSKDVVISFDVVEHLTKEENLLFADEIYRILKPEGKWIIHTVNGESPFFGKILYGDYTHELAFTRESISQLAYTAGFTKVSSFEERPMVHGLKSFIRKILWESIKVMLKVYLAAETGSLGGNIILSQNFLSIAEK